MIASDRLNTCKSRGSEGVATLLSATGARVSNAYATLSLIHIFLPYSIENSVFFLSPVDSFHQFVWCKYLHLGETKPLLAQVLNGCSYVIHIIVYTKEAVM